MVDGQGRGEMDSGVAGGLRSTADSARELAQTIERGADALDKASHTAERVTEKVERVSEATANARASLRRVVTDYPLAAAATALTLGFLVGRTRG